MIKEEFVLNKVLNRYRIRNLKPNSLYSISFCYRYVSSTNSDLLLDEVQNVVHVTTKPIHHQIKVNKISGSKITFTVTFDENYAYESSTLVIYSDNVRVGSVPVNSALAVTSDGFTETIDINTNIGYEVVLKLEDCMYEGESVESNVQTKFINR